MLHNNADVRQWATFAIEGANDSMVSHCIPGNAETLNRHQVILNWYGFFLETQGRALIIFSKLQHLTTNIR